MLSYNLRIFCCVCGAISSCSVRFVRIVLGFGTGMLLHRFVMSREARDLCGSSGVSLILCVFYIEGVRQWCKFVYLFSE